MRNFPLKQVPTMMASNWSWRKPPKPEKVAVICTKLICSAAIPAAIKTRNSEGFCEDNLLVQMSEQNSQGRGMTDLAYNSDTCPSRAGIDMMPHLPKWRMRPRKAASSCYYILLTFLFLVHCFQHLVGRCLLLGRKRCPTVKQFFQVRGQFYHFSFCKELR